MNDGQWCVLIADSWLGSVACTLALLGFCIFTIMNVKTACTEISRRTSCWRRWARSRATPLRRAQHGGSREASRWRWCATTKSARAASLSWQPGSKKGYGAFSRNG
eukprot:1003465-Pleurochrysis_carterae.AAC.3